MLAGVRVYAVTDTDNRLTKEAFCAIRERKRERERERQTEREQSSIKKNFNTSQY